MPLKEETKFGEKNLIWAMRRYICSSGEEAVFKKCEKEIFPCIDPDIKIENYTDVNLMLLRRLFQSIQEKHFISNKDFKEQLRELITGAIEKYFEEHLETDDPLWGAWYLAEDRDEEDPYGVFMERTLDGEEQRTLLELLTLPDAPGEAIGYALCVFTGLSVTEALNAKWKDISTLSEDSEILTIHTMGAFPMKREPTEYDARPRTIPLLDVLADALMKRKSEIVGSLTFPIETEAGIIQNIDELPIACQGNAYTEYSSIKKLSSYAANALKIALSLDELRLAYTSKDMLDRPFLYAYERSPAYYMGRRTFATMLFCTDAGESAAKQLMGHRWSEEYGEMPEVTEENLIAAKTGIEKLLFV